jgi:hypothetical protein
MKEEDEFYIGWQDEAPASFKIGRSKFFWGGLIVIVLFAVGYLFMENKFVDSYFDYGNLTRLEGTIVSYPVFGLRTEVDGKAVTVPLVGFGKFDALPVLEELKMRSDGRSLSSLKVGLQGTILTFQGKTWMELTEGDESIVSIDDSGQSYAQHTEHLGSNTIAGEIVDPKCFFGVMNPAYNKIHRSCAIRCISGGIPPVLAIREQGVFTDYYFVIDEDGKPLNQSILQYVGTPLSLSGQVEQVDDWKVLKVNVGTLDEMASLRLDDQLAMCPN